MPAGRTALLAAIAVALPAAVPASTQAPTYRVEGSLTRAAFAVTQLGLFRQEGRFERVWGKIVLDSAARGGSVDFILDGTSVSTGWDARDAFIRGEHMFDVARYPALRFRSVSLAWDAAALRAVEGEFTLRGVTRPVRLDVRELRCANARGHESCRAEVVGRISRADFGMEYGYPLIGDDVDFDFAITAVRVREEGETETP